MPKKFIISLLFASIFFSQTTFSNPPQANAQVNSMLEMAAMLPDSDIVATFDSERMLNIAAPDLLGNDAKKIEHLKNLMRTIENQIGINPYEIKQIALGIKFPAQAKVDSLDIIEKSDFAAIIRTANQNGNLLETWSQRIDVIMAFQDAQMPSRKYMDDFKTYREFKFEKATPEKIAAVNQKLNDSLNKIQEIDKKLNALPRLTTDAKTVANLRAKTKEIAENINQHLTLLKADTDVKDFRETSIKLLNRWNAITIDDAQRAAKLSGVFNESKTIAPAFKQKHENARKIEKLIALTETDSEMGTSMYAPNFFEEIYFDLDKTLTALNELPATKLKRTESLNSSTDNLISLNQILENKLSDINQEFETEIISESTAPIKTASPSFSLALKSAKSEEKINGKRMIVIDTAKLDEPVKNSEPKPDEKSPEDELKKEAPARLAIGFLDERTMVIGFEKSIQAFLKREAGYKNQKALEMLGNSPNSIMAFAITSTVIKSITSATPKTEEKPASENLFGNSALLSKLTDDINVYGSVNYDAAGNLTNDITMSLGFIKEKVAGDIAPKTSTAADNPNVDNTFEIAGYQVGKDIFYDLFASFKAVQASMTFKFEKKKIASLIRSTPRIIEKIAASKKSAKGEIGKTAKVKPRKLESFQELLTAPQFYVDLAGLFNRKNLR